MVIALIVAALIAGLALVAELLIRRTVTAVKGIRLPQWKRPARPTPSREGRLMAYLLLIGGTAATVAANYAHAEQNIGAKLLSAVIPVLLFIAFHAAANDGRTWIRVTTGVVALVCFTISFDHIMHLAGKYGESELSSVLYPLGIDGAMIVGTFILSRAADRSAVGASADLSEDKPFPTPVRKDNDARLSAATRIAADLGDKLSRATLVEALKAEGYTISTNEAATLTRELKAARS